MQGATTERATVQGYDIVFGGMYILFPINMFRFAIISFLLYIYPFIQVNYLSHVLWTHKLLTLLNKSKSMKNGGARVIQITSTMHGGVDGNDLISRPPLASVPLNTTFHKDRSYSNSKLAQIYHSRALNRQFSKNPTCDSSPSKASASCIRVVNVCPSWVGTSISASSSAEFIMTHLGYEADGFGVSSTLYAMFHPDASITLDYATNNRNFGAFVRPASRLLGSYPWLDRWNLRLVAWLAMSFLLLCIEKFIPDTGFVDSIEESYNETKQDALYAWSLDAIRPFL